MPSQMTSSPTDPTTSGHRGRRRPTRRELPALVVAAAHLHPCEATRSPTDLLLEATGHALAGDATVLDLDWHGRLGRHTDTRAEAFR